jgi:hypothetical protein
MIVSDTYCQTFKLWLRLVGFKGCGLHEMFCVIVDYPPLGWSSNAREKGSLSYFVHHRQLHFHMCRIFGKISKSTLELENATNELSKLVMRP